MRADTELLEGELELIDCLPKRIASEGRPFTFLGQELTPPYMCALMVLRGLDTVSRSD